MMSAVSRSSSSRPRGSLRCVERCWPSPAQPCVLGLERLQAPDLLGLEPAVLLPPAVVGHLGHTDRAHGVGDALALRDQDVHLAQLGDDLLGLVPLARHRGPPSCPKTYLRTDHFTGGGSVAPCLGFIRCWSCWRPCRSLRGAARRP